MRIGLVFLAVACRGTAPRDAVIEHLQPPEGWSVVRDETRVTLTAPERAVRVVIEASEHADARLAIASAWTSAGPAMLTAPSEIDVPPPEGGWDALATIEYAVGANRSASARWMRLGERGYVVLVDGDAAAVAKRDAQIAAIAGSVKPPGLREEVLEGATRALDSKALDSFVDRAMRELDVPGAAIGVVVDGVVVYSRAAGVRSLERRDPITSDTLFLMASVTKPMTTMMQAALVDAKVLRWDSPISELMPTFALGDPEITRRLQLWHMSCACTGMPRQDMEGLFEWDGVTPEARLAVMRAMKPTTELGETFQYSNPMVSAGGFIAAHAYAPDRSLAGAYEEAMQHEVFEPIGMHSTTTVFGRVVAGEHATPHALAIDGQTRAMPLAIERQVEPIAPAGAVWSNLRDMMLYAQTELGEGLAPNGTRIVSVERHRERLTPRVKIDEHSAYGLGIDVETYRGRRVLRHDGGSFGFGTRMWLMPDAKVAIVILTNVRNGNAKEQLPFAAAVTRCIVEALFASARSRADDQLAYFAKLRTRAPHVANADRAWIARLVGRYREDALGDVEIRETPEGVVFDAGEWRSRIDVAVGADGAQRIVMLDPPFAGPGVIVGPGDPPALIVPDQTPYTFTRVR